jgi:pyridoxine kinase
MACIIALSSQVARGHVGLSAMVPALAAMGHRVVALPTVLLSNHPGHGRAAGMQVPPKTLSEMADALDAHGWLAESDAVVTGYLPSAGHVEFAVGLIERVRQRRPGTLYVCDPVLGDDPKGIYIDKGAADAVRELLLPCADVAIPNRFELAWLTGLPVDDTAGAVRAARALRVGKLMATSVPAGDRRLANLLVTQDLALRCETALRAGVPHGTGDLMTALVTELLAE